MTWPEKRSRRVLSACAWAVVFALASSAHAATAPRPGPLGIHRVPLPNARRVSGGSWGDIDAVAGAPPSAAHPRGTAIVAQATADEPSPTVTEWDLATGGFVRSASLPLPAAQADMRIVRAGGALHLFASRAPAAAIDYARLRPSLETDRVEHLGSGERPRVATDGTRIAVLWSGVQENAPADRGWQLAVLDARGDRLWAARLTRTTESTSLHGDPLAVVAGHVFVLLPDGGQPAVVEFDTNGRAEHVGSVPWSPDEARLFSARQRLLFTDDCTVAALWPDAREDRPRTPLAFPMDHARSCAPFQPVADLKGELVTSRGDVFSPAFSREYHFADPRGAALRRPLWVYETPALLVVEARSGHAWLDWGEAPNALPQRPSFE